MTPHAISAVIVGGEVAFRDGAPARMPWSEVLARLNEATHDWPK